MDATHLHLILTHFPIVGTIIGVAIMSYGIVTKKTDIIKVALFTFILMALVAIPVYLTGEEAEETVEHLAGVSEHVIHEHEELAEKAIVLMGLLGVLALINLFSIIKKLGFSKILSTIVLILSLVTFGVFAKVGSLGGEIRHSEIRKTNDFNKGTNEEGFFRGENKSHEQEEHDDD